LTDYENGILNLVPLLQPYFVALPGRDADLVAFGYLLYEMTVGYEIQSPESLYIPPDVPRQIQSILVGIFGEEGRGDKIQNVDDLIGLPFFGEVALKDTNTKKTRIESKGKEMLRIATKNSIIGNAEIVKETRGKGNRASRPSSARTKRRVTSSGSHQGSPANTIDTKTTVGSVGNNPSSSSTGTTPAASSVPDIPKSSGPPPSGNTSSPPPSGQAGRGQLLSSITSFDKKKLQKSDTNDRSGPIIPPSNDK